MQSSQSISIDHLQSRLLRLIEEVRTQRSESERLRAEVLAAMHQLCSADLLLSLWQTLERLGPRSELMMVHLLKDMESSKIDKACRDLLASRDEMARAVGYAIVALRARDAGAKRIAKGLRSEPGIVLKRGGLRVFAPYSFITCMLAGIREFKDPLLDELAIDALRAFAGGKQDLDLLIALVDDKRPQVAQLGFVALASQFMGIVHHAAYTQVVCGRPLSLSRQHAAWLRRALKAAPEVLEAMAEPGPSGVGSAEFIRARGAILRSLGQSVHTELVNELLTGRLRLPSIRIERGLYKGASDAGRRNASRSKYIAYLLSLFVGHRAGLAQLVAALAEEGELETITMARVVELSGPEGALNVPAAVVGFWDQLDRHHADEAPFWRWIDGFWQDDRHARIDEAVEAALMRPDETSVWATRVLASVGDSLGKLLAALRRGEAIDLATLTPLAEHPHLLPALRASLLDDEAKLHPQSIVVLARAGVPGLERAVAQQLGKAGAQEHQAAWALAHDMITAETIVSDAPLHRSLRELGLRVVDRELESPDSIQERLGRDHPTAQAANSVARGALCSLYFWHANAKLPSLVGSRPASGYAARAEFVVDLDSHHIAQAVWCDRDGNRHTDVQLRLPPGRYARDYEGVPWDTTTEELPRAIKRSGGTLLESVALGPDGVRLRIAALLDGTLVRLETDNGRFCRAYRPLSHKQLEPATKAAQARFGDPLFRTGTQVVWRFQGLEVGICPDPAFNTLAEVIALVRTLGVVRE